MTEQPITIQIQIEDCSQDKISEIYSLMNDLCSKLEKYGYVRYELYKGEHIWNPK